MADGPKKEIGFDECFKILATHFFSEFSKITTDYEIINLPKKADVLVVEADKPITNYLRIFDYFKRFNIIEFKSANDPFRVDSDVPKILVYTGGIMMNEKNATFENTTFTLLTARKPVKLFKRYKKDVQKVKNGVYLLKNLVRVPVHVVVANEVVYPSLKTPEYKDKGKKGGNLDRELALVKEFSTGIERRRFIRGVLHEVLKGNHRLKEYVHFAYSLYKNEMHKICEKEGMCMTIVEKNIREWVDELGLKDGYKKEGKIEGKIEDAINMKKEGFDDEFIAKITGLPLKKIEEL
jgi:hypothetical protein